MNPETRFRELLSKLLADDFSASDRAELAELCELDESFRDALRDELELDELIRHAASDPESSARHFSGTVASRISGQMPDFDSLKEQLIAGELAEENIGELVRHCRSDEEKALQLCRDLKWNDLLEQASTEGRSEENFVESLRSRISDALTDFGPLKEQLIEGDAGDNEIGLLIRHCQRDEENATAIRKDLFWNDLLEQASTERRSEENFVESLRLRISDALTDFDTLKEQLIEGDAGDSEIGQLIRHCRRDGENAASIRKDLFWNDLLGQASTEGRSEESFIDSLESRISGEQPGFDALIARVIEAEASSEEIDELVRHCWRDEANIYQLRRELKWAELLELATAEHRSEDAFVDSLVTRMWAEQEQDHFVEETQSKIVNLYPDSVQPPDPARGHSKVISIGTWATAAAAALAVGAIFLLNQPEDAVAMLVHSTEDVRWKEEPSGKSGELTRGQYALESGIVTLGFANGAELTVEGPAEFDLRGESAAYVHSGIAVLDQHETTAGDSVVSGAKTGFTLYSRGLDVVDTHDTVGIDARNAFATEAVVFNGGAEICIPGRCRSLYEYEAVRVDLKREKLFDIPYNPKVFSRSWEVLAGVESNTGSVRIEMPGKNPEQAESGEEEVQVFVERDRFVAGKPIEVDTLNPGQFSFASNARGIALEEKGELRSYLLQLWPEDSDDRDSELEASVTFSHEVVGVIYSSKRLEQSDSIVGSKLAAERNNSARGLDGSEANGDSILLSDNRRTVNLRLQSGSDSDQLDHVRVLVALR